MVNFYVEYFNTNEVHFLWVFLNTLHHRKVTEILTAAHNINVFKKAVEEINWQLIGISC